MNIEYYLESSDTSMLIAEEKETSRVMIAVPHHAPLGTTLLRCKDTKRGADENAGFVGYHTARIMNCSYIIACNYFIDPNKNTDTDYFKMIQSVNPLFLVEIHGHGKRSAKFDIEISSGNAERNKWSGEMSNRLKSKLSKFNSFNNYTISGDFNKIYFKATNSASITTDKWIPFHIELPKSIRARKSEYFPFCELLSETINSLLTDFDDINTKLKTRI
jgi:hypothetical protein